MIKRNQVMVKGSVAVSSPLRAIGSVPHEKAVISASPIPSPRRPLGTCRFKRSPDPVSCRRNRLRFLATIHPDPWRCQYADVFATGYPPLASNDRPPVYSASMIA